MTIKILTRILISKWILISESIFSFEFKITQTQASFLRIEVVLVVNCNIDSLMEPKGLVAKGM